MAEAGPETGSRFLACLILNPDAGGCSRVTWCVVRSCSLQIRTSHSISPPPSVQHFWLLFDSWPFWIKSFSDEYKSKTGVCSLLYASPSWVGRLHGRL